MVHTGNGGPCVINQTGGASDIPNSSDLGSAYQLLWDSNPGQPSNPVIIPLTNTPNQTSTVSLPINGQSVVLRLRIYYNESF